jgi:hypothetical protein
MGGERVPTERKVVLTVVVHGGSGEATRKQTRL